MADDEVEFAVAVDVAGSEVGTALVVREVRGGNAALEAEVKVPVPSLRRTRPFDARRSL